MAIGADELALCDFRQNPLTAQALGELADVAEFRNSGAVVPLHRSGMEAATAVRAWAFLELASKGQELFAATAFLRAA